MMNYADKWSENKVTAITDLKSETTSFYAWNGTKLDTELFEIKVFPISEWESGKSDDFTLITKDDKYAYTFIILCFTREHISIYNYKIPVCKYGNLQSYLYLLLFTIIYLLLEI